MNFGFRFVVALLLAFGSSRISTFIGFGVSAAKPEAARDKIKSADFFFR